MATPADLRIEVVQDLQKWSLLFCSYASYRDLFGEPESEDEEGNQLCSGMVPLEVTEVYLAYDEWERYRKARESWDEEHKGSDLDDQFDTEGYIRDRIFCLENDLDRVPLDPL